MNNIANLLKNNKQYAEAEDYLKTAVQLKYVTNSNLKITLWIIHLTDDVEGESYTPSFSAKLKVWG